MDIKNIVDIINKNTIFKGISEEEIIAMLNDTNYNIKKYNKNEIIASEMSKCSSIAIVLAGSVEIKKLYSNGKVVTLTRLFEGDIFGEIIIFSGTEVYPANVVSIDDSEILFIDKKDVEELCTTHKNFMINVLRLLSKRILMLNRKITFLSYQTIRQKIAYYLIQEYNKNNSKMFMLPISRKDMSELIGIPRPSLSREFMKLKDEGIIDYESKTIKILDLKKLEDCLF